MNLMTMTTIENNTCAYPDVCSFDADPEYADGWRDSYKFCDTNGLRTSWFWLDYNIVPGAKFWVKLTTHASWHMKFDLKKTLLMRSINCRQSGEKAIDVSVYEKEADDIWAASKGKLSGKPLQQEEVRDGYAYVLSYHREMAEVYARDKHRQEYYPMDKSLHLTCKTFQGLLDSHRVIALGKADADP